MAASAPPAPDAAPRLTPLTGALMLAGALALFAAAYAVGGLFGRQADDEAADASARSVPALQPAGTPLLTLAAWEVAFDTRELRVPANRPVQLRVDNRDAGIFHNLAVYRDPRATELVARGALFTGPAVHDYHFDGFPPGTYYFQCDLHPAMKGMLVSE